LVLGNGGGDMLEKALAGYHKRQPRAFLSRDKKNDKNFTKKPPPTLPYHPNLSRLLKKNRGAKGGGRKKEDDAPQEAGRFWEPELGKPCLTNNVFRSWGDHRPRTS